jgi:hypothetical protein
MLRAAILSALIASAGTAQACGYCVEDKIASVYDHALVTQSLAQKHHVAFFHIDGPLAPGEGSRRLLEAAATSTAGIDKGSVRVAVETLTLAVAFDPRRTSLIAVQNALQKKLAAKGLSLMPLRVIDGTAQLTSIKR